MESQPSYTLNGLKRWCCNEPTLPPISSIKELHVYDFDNTVFKTPLPNKSLWEHSTWSRLQNQDMFAHGGWWHNVAVLAATGDGIELEEPRAWHGHWNEKIVELIRLSMQEEDVLTVLLTGRSEEGFADLVQRICRSKKLEFDIYALKPLVSLTTGKKPSTMVYKQEFLTVLMHTYGEATSLKLYEDRAHHVKDFRSFFQKLSASIQNGIIQRQPLEAEVVQVADLPGQLDPVVEAAAIQQAVNEHNNTVRAGTSPYPIRPLKIVKTSLYTAYQIRSQQDSARLLSLVKLPATARKLASSILITTYPADAATMQKAGGAGKRIRFEVQSVGFIASRIWAVKVKSTGAQTFTTLGPLQVVLALNDDARPHEARQIKEWHPLPANSGFQFDAVVGDVYRLRIEEETAPFGASAPSKVVPQKRHHTAPDAQSHRQSKSRNGFNSQKGQQGANKSNHAAGKASYAQTAARAAPQYQQQRDASHRGNHGGRGGRGRPSREVSGRRNGYKDHDAAVEPIKAGSDANMHNNY